MNQVTVIGAGLAGAECAWQLARRGILAVLRGERGKTGRVTVVATPKGLAPVTFEITVR